MKQPIRESPLSDRDLKYLQMGRAATIPGIQFAIDVLAEHMTQTKNEMYSIQDLLAQRLLGQAPAAKMREAAATVKEVAATVREARLALQVGSARIGTQIDTPTAKRRGRPPKNKMSGIKAYWASMTEEERSAEMLRRRAKGQGRGGYKRPAAKKLHPRDAEHPGHAEWVANITKAVRKRWKQYSPKEQKQRIEKALAGRRTAQPTVTLERIA